MREHGYINFVNQLVQEEVYIPTYPDRNDPKYHETSNVVQPEVLPSQEALPDSPKRARGSLRFIFSSLRDLKPSPTYAFRGFFMAGALVGMMYGITSSTFLSSHLQVRTTPSTSEASQISPFPISEAVATISASSGGDGPEQKQSIYTPPQSESLDRRKAEIEAKLKNEALDRDATDMDTILRRNLSPIEYARFSGMLKESVALEKQEGEKATGTKYLIASHYTINSSLFDVYNLPTFYRGGATRQVTNKIYYERIRFGIDERLQVAGKMGKIESH